MQSSDAGYSYVLMVGKPHLEVEILKFAKSNFFWVYAQEQDVIRIMPKWGLITRLGSKVMSIAVNYFFWCPTFMTPTHFFVF